jgi:hypothetical protein
MLDGKGLGAYISQHYRRAGDRKDRIERLRWYNVPSQNADREAFLTGTAPDWDRKQSFLDDLAEEKARGLISNRVRIFPAAELNDDELMSCHLGYPYVGRDQDIRVLHGGEHPIPDILDHDYWIHVLRMHYADDGAFLGATAITDPRAQTPYLREWDVAWMDSEDFDNWWARHGELHRDQAA